jgi:hypothetical protein
MFALNKSVVAYQDVSRLPEVRKSQRNPTGCMQSARCKVSVQHSVPANTALPFDVGTTLNNVGLIQTQLLHSASSISWFQRAGRLLLTCRGRPPLPPPPPGAHLHPEPAWARVRVSLHMIHQQSETVSLPGTLNVPAAGGSHEVISEGRGIARGSHFLTRPAATGAAHTGTNPLRCTS